MFHNFMKVVMGLAFMVVIATFGIYIYWHRMNKKLEEADPNNLEMVDASTFNVLGGGGGKSPSSSSSSSSSFHFKDRKHTIEEFDNDEDDDNMTKNNNHNSYVPPQLSVMNSVLSNAMNNAMVAMNSTMTTIKSSTNEAYRKLNNKVAPNGYDNNNDNDNIIYSPLNNETKDDEFEL